MHMSACDVAQLLELNESNETSLFDLQRLKATALKQLHAIEARKRDPLIITYYECMIQIIVNENAGAVRPPMQARNENQTLEFIL